MAAFIVALLLLSLTANVIPLLNVVAILALFPLRLFWSEGATPDRRLGPRTAVHFLLAAYAFWIFTYLLTTAPLVNLFAYDFLRFEGALFVGYLPLLLLGDVGLRPGFVYRLIWTYLGILAGVAILGAGLLVLLSLGHDFFMNIPVLNNMLEVHLALAMPVMFLGLYRTHMGAGNAYAIASLVALCFMLRARKPKLFSWTGLLLVGLLSGLILSGARTAYVAFTAAFLFQLARKKTYFRPLVRVAALVMIPAILFALSNPIIQQRVASILYFKGDYNVLGRFHLYRIAAEEFALSPLIGIGLGRFNDTGKTYSGIPHLVYIATGAEVVNADIQVHDSYLQFLAEGGIVGLFLMLGVWVATYRWAGRLRRRFEETSSAAALCQSVQATVLMTFFSSLTGTSMVMATTPLLVFTLVGLLRNVTAYEYKMQPARFALAVGRLDTSGLAGLHGLAEAD
jgi:O-antigen ligase